MKSLKKLERLQSNMQAEIGDIERFIFQRLNMDVPFSVEYQPSDGWVLSIERETSSGVPINAKLNTILKHLNNNGVIDEDYLLTISL